MTTHVTAPPRCQHGRSLLCCPLRHSEAELYALAGYVHAALDATLTPPPWPRTFRRALR